MNFEGKKCNRCTGQATQIVQGITGDAIYYCDDCLDVVTGMPGRKWKLGRQ